jgi:IS30 family transposase
VTIAIIPRSNNAEVNPVLADIASQLKPGMYFTNPYTSQDKGTVESLIGLFVSYY